MVDSLVEEFRANIHIVHQSKSADEDFYTAEEKMRELWMKMNWVQREDAIKGYKWLWIPPETLAE